MNILDTMEAIESKMNNIDALLESFNQSSEDGQRFKAHGFAKDAEKEAEEMLRLAKEMDTSDLDDILKAQEQLEIQDIVDSLDEKIGKLSLLFKEYSEIAKSGDEINARRVLNDIQQIGIEIVRITDV